MPVTLGPGREVVEDLDLEGLTATLEERATLDRGELAADERMIGRDALGHPRLDRGEVVGRQRPRQLEVVVEAVGDRRPDPELRAREEIEDRLGHDVRGRMPHRVEVAVRPGIEQLVGGPALGRLEQLVVVLWLANPVLLVAHRPSSSENHETPRPSTGREVHSRGPTRLREPWGSRARGRANGRRPGRFAGRSRVVSMRFDRRACSRGPALCGPIPARGVPIDAISVMWWATLDSNQ